MDSSNHRDLNATRSVHGSGLHSLVLGLIAQPLERIEYVMTRMAFESVDACEVSAVLAGRRDDEVIAFVT